MGEQRNFPNRANYNDNLCLRLQNQKKKHFNILNKSLIKNYKIQFFLYQIKIK